mgnify:FL=1
MKTLLIIIYSIVAVVLTFLTLSQSKEDEGASSAITGGSSFFEKNKGRTKEGQLKKYTIILGVVFIILAIILSIVY